VGDDVNVGFVAIHVLVTTKRKNQIQEKHILQTYPASTTSRVGVSNVSPTIRKKLFRDKFLAIK